MDQTINEMMYVGRINSTARAWKDQMEGKMTSGASIIASDGTSYKKIDGRLVPVVDEKLLKRLSKVVTPSLQEAGLLKTAETCDEKIAASASTELVAEL